MAAYVKVISKSLSAQTLQLIKHPLVNQREFAFQLAAEELQSKSLKYNLFLFFLPLCQNAIHSFRSHKTLLFNHGFSQTSCTVSQRWLASGVEIMEFSITHNAETLECRCCIDLFERHSHPWCGRWTVLHQTGSPGQQLISLVGLSELVASTVSDRKFPILLIKKQEISLSHYGAMVCFKSDFFSDSYVLLKKERKKEKNRNISPTAIEMHSYQLLSCPPRGHGWLSASLASTAPCI